MICINKNSVEYQSLKERAGISEFKLDSVCRRFLEKYDRFPYLDEINGSNSEPSLKQYLKINKNNGIKISHLLETTGKSSVREANIEINNQFRDLETTILPIVDEAIVEVEHRPTTDNFDVVELEQDIDVDSYQVLTIALNKLASLYGINFKQISDAELNTKEWKDLIPEKAIVNAFIYNGNIYINTDKNMLDAPIHEMFHIFVGSLRFTNPELYQSLIQSVESFPNYPILASNYQNRTRNDINEEILVTEVSKYLAGYQSDLSNLDNKTRYEITYNIKRMLDTILMGQDSVKTISEDRLFTLSLKDIAAEVNSAVMINNFRGTMNVAGSELHRRLNNEKSDLFKQGLLEEICE